ARLQPLALGDDMAVVVAVDVDGQVGEGPRVDVDLGDVVGDGSRPWVEEDVGEGLPEHRLAGLGDVEGAAVALVREEVPQYGGDRDRLQELAPADGGRVGVERDARGADRGLGDVVAGVRPGVGEGRVTESVRHAAPALGVGAGD